MRYYPLFLFLFIGTTITAQTPTLPKLQPARPLPPNEAGLYKVIDRPIGNYTGTVPVSFPLTSLHAGPLTVDLSLVYNSTGGIKVAEMGGVVGLGFSLANGAGVITQQVRDLPDDQGYGMLNTPYAITPGSYPCGDLTWADIKDKYFLDLEADQYYYNVKGKSGKFLVKEDGTIALCDNSGFTISYVWNSSPKFIKQWILTDDEGNVFYFGQNKAGTVDYKSTNTSTYSDGLTSSGGITSVSWYLTEAYDFNEENKVTYSYIQGSSAIYTASAGTKPLTDLMYCNNLNQYNVRPATVTVQNDGMEYLVSRIDATDGYLTFHYSTGRTDMVSHKLDSIKKYGVTSILEKQILFDYAYFSGAARLKLKSFTQTDGTRSDSLTHKFEYEEAVNLPNYFAQTDFWGFYNGSATVDLYPSYVMYYGGQWLRNFGGGMRSAKAQFAVANILKKIVFPSGGYRQFFYEGNTALLSENPTKFHPDAQYTMSRSFTNSTFTAANIDPVPCLKQNFTISSFEGSAKFNFNVTGINASTCPGVRLALYKVATAGETTGGTQIFSGNITTGSPELQNGFYRIEVYKQTASCTISGVTGNWTEYTLTNDQISVPQFGWAQKWNRNVGGVRIQEVRDYDPLTGKSNSTYYKYQLPADTTLTSGLLISPVKIITSISLPAGCNYAALVPQGSYPLSTQDNSAVVYTQVRTIESGNGWIDNSFTYATEYPLPTFPETPAPDQSYRRGLLYQQSFYDQSGRLLKKTNNQYSYNFITSQQGVRIKPYFTCGVQCTSDTRNFVNPNLPPIQVDCATYGTSANITLLVAKFDSTFAPNGLGIGVRTDYSYIPYQLGFLLKSVKTTINNGQTKFQTYKYASTSQGDFLFPLTSGEKNSFLTPGAFSALRVKNYRQPVEVIDSLQPVSGNGLFIKGERRYWVRSSSNLTHISKSRSYTTPSDYTEYNIQRYDSRGNILEASNTLGIKEIYLWGYNRSRLVGIVRGVDYSFVSTLFDPTTLDLSPPGLGVMRSQMQLIRTGLASNNAAQITSFIWENSDYYTSERDPAGKSVYFYTDFLGRLKYIKADNNYIIKSLDYKLSGTN